MDLNEFLTKHALTQSQFGQKFDPPVSQGLVHQWLKGITNITLARALQIERITNGEVSVHDCASIHKTHSAKTSTIKGTKA